MNDLESTIVALKPETTAPDDDARARAARRLDELIAAPAQATRGRVGWRLLRPSAGARHVRRWGFAMAGATVIAAVVAFSPFADEQSSPIVPSPMSAQAALQQAAAAAGAVDWSPLAAGEYHHTMTTSFTPDIPTRTGDPQEKIDRILSFAPPMSAELWLARDGHGLHISTMGGNGKADEYPKVHSGGYGVSPTFGSGYPEPEDVGVRTSLRLADTVQVELLPSAEGPVTSSLWYRSPRGYVRRAHRTGRGYEPPGTDTMGEGLQARHWGATMSRLDQVNEASDSERREAVRKLLDEFVPGVSNNELWRLGEYGATRATILEDGRIVRAIELLGSAPLAPEVRSELFDWLSRHPLARLEGDASDELGRPGTRVTFERIHDEVVPGEVVTLDELRHEFERQAGKRPEGAVRGPKAVRVKEDHQYRRWYVSVVFDRTTGELLEHALYMRQETTAQRPRLQHNTIRGRGAQPPWRVAMAVDRQAAYDAVLYEVRERTTVTSDARTPACAATPRMCR